MAFRSSTRRTFAVGDKVTTTLFAKGQIKLGDGTITGFSEDRRFLHVRREGRKGFHIFHPKFWRVTRKSPNKRITPAKARKAVA